VQLRILGPFEVCDDSGEPVKLPAGHERALLAVLALRRGEVVSTDGLVDALWGEQPPPTAAKALQGYVSHLRRILESAGETGVLVTQPPGYLLRLADEAVDARRFEVLAAQGWRQLDDDPAGAVATFEAALALWHGPALGEFAFSDFAQREIHRLDELRLETIEGRLEGQLRLGRHGAVVAELEARVDEHPLRERLRGQLMLALYRCGRQAEALEVYRDGRRRLANDLGLEPGSELQRLERQILEQDPALDAPTPARGPHGASSSGPRRVRGRRVAMAVILVVAAVAGVTLGYLVVRDDASGSVAIAPPALVAVDPATNRVVASIRVGSRPSSVSAGADAVWVGDARDGTVTRIDPADRTVVKTIGIGSPVVDLATGVGGLWAATGGIGDVVQIDPEDDAVAKRIALGDPDDPFVPSVSAIGVGDGRVWAGTVEGLVQIDPDAGAIVRRVPGVGVLQIAVGGGAVWSTTLTSRAIRTEARSARETASYYAGNWVYPIVLGGGAGWVGGAAGLSKVDPVTAAALFSSRPASDVSSIAFGEGSVWVVSGIERSLARLNPETGEVEARIELQGVVVDLLVDDGLVWLAVQRPD
jgi:DNA-binding SARP family transcriptional activator/streptogramin lyase